MNKLFTFPLPEKLKAKLRLKAFKEKRPMAELIREAVEKYLKRKAK